VARADASSGAIPSAPHALAVGAAGSGAAGGVRVGAAGVALAAIVALLLALACLVCVARADADATSEYGEVARFGGFDESAFNRAKYGGPPTPGEFLDPTGFAVDPEEEDDVYVADLVSSAHVEPTVWRIQKLSPSHCGLDAVPAPAGCVLGTTLFTLPRTSALAGIAVDHRAGRLYALVIGSARELSPFKDHSLAQELLAWSTTPNERSGLVAASESGGGRLPSDPLSSETPEGAATYQATVGGLVSSQAQLQPHEGLHPTEAAERAWLVEPQGIAIDRLEAPSVDDPVVIEASDGKGEVGPTFGDTIVQQVATQSQLASPPAADVSSGQLLARWSSASVAEEMGGSWGPGGIFDNPDGSLSVIVKTAASPNAAESYVVRLSPDFAQAAVLNPVAPTESNPLVANLREVALSLDEEPPFRVISGGGIASFITGAGPEVAQLSTATSSSADGLYAGDFVHPVETQESWYWVKYGTSGHFGANVGVRLLRPTASGEISNPHGETIANTLGNATQEAPCNIGAEEAALAAGADGTLWVLDRGPTSGPEIPSSGVALGRQIIELAPGAGKLCPQPSGAFTMTHVELTTHLEDTVQAGAAPLEVPVGTEVTFNGRAIDLQHGWPFSWEWEVVGAGVRSRVVNREEKSSLYPPTPVYRYTFERPGSYTVRAKLLSDYGAYTPPLGTVIVTGLQGNQRPQAVFKAEQVGGSQQAQFNASESSPGDGTILDYIWSWGDGSSLESDGPGMPIVTHTYQQAGTFTVTLTVVNSLYQASTSAPQRVTVVAPSLPPAATSESPLSGPIYQIPLPAANDPTPPPGPDRGATDVSPRARFAHGAIKVELSCPATKQECAGTVQTETAAAIAAVSNRRGRRGRGAGGRARRVVLGAANFQLAGGRTETVRVALGRRGAALLRARGHLTVLVIVAAHDQFGDPYSETVRLTLARTATSAASRAGRDRHGAGGR
jgi:PKD repeat protein